MMSSKEKILDMLKRSGLIEEDDMDFELLISRLSRQKGAYISIPLDVKQEEKPQINLNHRLIMVEEDLSKLKRHFEQYLKPEFKEESNTVFIQMMKLNEEIKQIYIKPSEGYIRYYVIYDTDNYIELLEKMVDIEIKIEEIYPMLTFEFIHKNIDELEVTNLNRTYLVYDLEE